MHDNCESCGRDYEFRPEVDLIIIYPFAGGCRFNHLQATCPHCVHVTIIFLGEDVLEKLITKDKLRYTAYFTVHDQIARARAQFDEVVPEPEPLWLSPRTERFISYFRDQLERGLQE